MGLHETEKRILGSTSKLPLRMAKEPLFIVPENPIKFNEIKRYLNLNENYKIKINPFSGEIYIATYRHNQKEDLQSQHSKDEIVLMQRGRNPSQKIVKRWNSYQDIESAIRSAEHISDRYGKEKGKEVENTRGIIDLTKRLLTKFESGNVSNENIEEITQETSKELAALGFDNAEKPIKQEMASQIINAAGKDKLGRVNPLISTTRLASACLKAIRELLVDKKIREKFSAISMDLESEREVERFYLSQATVLIQKALEKQTISDFKAKIPVLKTYFLTFLSPEKMKVAPYRNPALFSRYSLFGIRNEDRYLFTKMFPNEQKTLNAINLPPIDKVMREAMFMKTACGEIQERLIESLESINNVLDKGTRDLEKKEVKNDTSSLVDTANSIS